MAITQSDQQVCHSVLEMLRHDMRVDSARLTVDVTGGIVLLSGTVPSYAQKVTAGEITRRMKGVVGIENNLVVSFAHPSSGDHVIKKAVRRRLISDARIECPNQITILVTRGVVTLKGMALSYNQKVAAAEDAWPVEGVVNVINNICVEPSVLRPDEEIAADVHTLLAHDPSINPSNIVVFVEQGAVRLRGTVPSYYQIDEAANAVRRVPAITNVVNDLTVRLAPPDGPVPDQIIHRRRRRRGYCPGPASRKNAAVSSSKANSSA